MYKYFAFISFQSSDAREAVRLQHAIERYRLPAVLCRDKHTPRRVRPLFCYLNDIHAGEELMQELRMRMEQSRYLIVVCSPRAAQSAYVNSGIDYFVSLGRRDSIIPVIVDGVPYSGDRLTECFPEALRRHFPKHADPLQDHSILGINIHERGFGSVRATYNRAMLMIVARMLDLDFDGLLLRDRQRRLRLRLAGVGTAMMVVACILAVWHFSRSTQVQIRLSEQTTPNHNLPTLKDAELTLTFANEQKSALIAEPLAADTGCMAVVPNVPMRFVGRSVRVQLACRDCLPLDTLLPLARNMCLPLCRDEHVYGDLHFRLVAAGSGVDYSAIAIRIADTIVQPDVNGDIDCHLPLAEQQVAYPLQLVSDKYAGMSLQPDTIYPPCGTNDVIEIVQL